MSHANDFVIDNGILISYTGADENVTIPETVNKIGSYVFENKKTIRNLVIPDSVTDIGYAAFAGQTLLETVRLSGSITKINSRLFEGCAVLKTIEIPEGVSYIDSSAFCGCRALEKVQLPGTLTEISYNVFAECENLEEINLPDSLWKVGGDSFRNCHKLEDEQGMILINGILLKYMADADTVVIPAGVRAIGNRAFQVCRNIRHIQIPDTVKLIDEFAFAGCENLEELEIPDSVETVADYAFTGCAALKHIKLPAGLTVIGRQLLSDCKSLKEISIPEGVTKIGSVAFSNCTGLTNLELPEKLREIGGAAFSGCTSLESVRLPGGIQEIPASLFCDCAALTVLPFAHRIKAIGPRAFAGCRGLMDAEGFLCFGDTLHTYAGEMRHVILPRTVTQVEEGCFHGCKNLQSVTVPETIRKIDGCRVETFATEQGLLYALSVSRGDNPDVEVRFLCGADFFSQAQPWMKDRIAKTWLYGWLEYSPELIAAVKKYIGRVRDRLFAELQEDSGEAATKLLSCGKIKPEKIESYIRNCDSAKLPSVMAVLLDYQMKNVPKAKQEELADKALGIVERTAKEWSKIYRWTEAEGAITLTKYKGHDTVVEIPWHIEGIPVTVIGKNAFKNNVTLEEIHMTPNITAVMESAFEGCENLKEIHWSEKLELLEKRAFYNCYQLTVVRLPENLKEIGVNAFGSTFNFANTARMHLSQVYLPEKIKKFKGFLGEFMDYHVDVWFAGDKTKMTDKDFYGAEVTLHVKAGSKTEEYAKQTSLRVVAE